ncbi:hypothetical protein [Nonomuraea sp. NPDC049695]|uniref:hypothetical protein n=1 Tax=Nonomuraea sp. NPDC049695 TaxID=3154734 RepID=UPI0034466E62
MRVSLLLIRPLTRAIDWKPLALTVPVTVGLMAPLGLLFPEIALGVQRMSALLLGGAAAFGLADAMDPDTAAAPVPRRLRQWLRTAMTVIPATLAWAAVHVITARGMPLREVVVEAAVLLLIGLVVTGFAVRHRAAGLAGGAALLIVIAATIPLLGVLPDVLARTLPGLAAGDAALSGRLACVPLWLGCLALSNRESRR